MRVQLSIVESTPDRLTLRYSTVNERGREIYLFNRLFRAQPSGARSMAPDRVYAWVDGLTLHLALDLIEVPETMEVELPEVPYLTRLEPGESLAGEVTLALPAREDHPYLRRTKGAGTEERTVECEGVMLSLGYFVAEEPRWVREVIVDEAPALATDYGFAVKTHRTLDSAIVATSVPCLVTR